MNFKNTSPLGQYQRDMLSNLRKVNADYHQVGWYQSTYLGPHFSQVFLESHFQYQLEIEESVVLIYGKQYNSVYFSILFGRPSENDSWEFELEGV